jgi:very-short-patch-repair endonuclease
MKAEKPVGQAAKELRQKQIEAERRLWFKLRDNQISNLKFRRQEPIGSIIVDFVNYEKKLIIELYGSPHKKNEIVMNDTYRTQWLESQGFKVLRFWNSEILNDLGRVVEKIKKYINL